MGPVEVRVTRIPDVNQPAMTAIPLTVPSVGQEEIEAVLSVFSSHWLAGQGPQSESLEAAFREHTKTRHAVALNNCTAGLHLALKALGVASGDEILVADYSFPATGHAVLYCGATPVFVDVRPDTGTIDVSAVEAQITQRTRGIVAVDALGMPADWGPLTEIARKHDLFLVEDAACAAGGEYQGRPCGSFGDVAVFSLHARKGITCGEGGVLVTDQEDLAAFVRRTANFGMQSAFTRQASEQLSLPSFGELGYNYKLSDILAAIATAQLSKLGAFLETRRSIASRYGLLLRDLPGVNVPVAPLDRIPTWQTYAIALEPELKRDAVVIAMRKRGIGCNIGTYALHEQSVYGAESSRCPVSAGLFRQHLALPMYGELTEAEQDRVVETLAAVLKDMG